MLPSQSPIFSFVYDLRSRYAETDKMGYVYYGRYLEYFEVARTEMIRSLGMPYSELENEGVMLPVVQAQVKYHAPIHYDELMHIHVHLYSIPTVKLETYYEICTGRRSSPHAVGSVILCFMNEQNRKPCRAPGPFISGLKEAIQ